MVGLRVAAAAGVLHYFWLVKKDVVSYPLAYGVVLLVLLLSRLWWAADRARARRAPALRRAEVDPAA